MQINPYIFREYDLRGREDGEELNEKVMKFIGLAYGTFLAKRGITNVAAGHDNRGTSERFHASALEGLLETGCRVIDIGTVLTPMMYWSQYHFKTEGGLMITASHNPVGWNGAKFATGFSQTMGPGEIRELYESITQEQFVTRERGTILKEQIKEEYFKDLLSRAPVKKSFKVVVNTGNGTAGFFAPDLLRKAGCEVIEHLTDPDPRYPHYTPNPAQVLMMEDTGRVVRESKADFGFAFDGDGDRLGLVDEKGQIIWPDRYLILLARLALEKKPGAKIVFDVKCSQALEEDIKNHGGVPIMGKTGHSYIKEKVRKEGAVLGGEMSGHVFFVENYYGFDDACFTALNLLLYFSSQQKKVSEIIAETPYYVSTPAFHASCPDEKKYLVVAELQEEFKKEGYSVIDINGARVLFQDGWGLVRASSNLPALVLRFEAKTKEGVEEIEKIFREKLARYDFVGKEWVSA